MTDKNQNMKFNFNAPITDLTSYGIVALNVIRETPCNIYPINSVSVDQSQLREMVNKRITSQIFNPNLPSVRLFHQFSLAESIGRGKRVGWPIFELDRFNRVEVEHLTSCDHLFVCSDWAANVIKNNEINVPVSVIPLGVDRSIFHEVSYEPNKYIFLSAGKWEIRKGQNDIVEAFNRAFNPSDETELWMSMYNAFMPKEEMDKIRIRYLNTKMGRAGKIKFVGPFKTQNDLARIMQSVSCGVFPSKAEGWGMETLEMMSCGKPVIVSNYSAHTEYCDDNNSLLIDPDGIVPAHDGMWFFGQGNWCTIPIDSIVDAMLYAYRAGNKVNNDGIITAEKYSWKNTADCILKSL